MDQAASKGEERLARIAIRTVLFNSIFDVLSCERILEFCGEDRQAIEKQDKVQAIIVFLAVVQLANFTKKGGAIEVQQIIVQATGWDKVDKLKPATIGLDAFTQYMQCAASAQFAGQSLQERRPGIALVLLLELLPFFGLCGINEIEDIFGNEAESLIIFF